jgi:hypothetical protein
VSPLEYETPVRRPRGWDFLAVITMVALGVMVLGLAKLVVSTKTAVPPPTTAPAYGTRGW